MKKKSLNLLIISLVDHEKDTEPGGEAGLLPADLDDRQGGAALVPPRVRGHIQARAPEAGHRALRLEAADLGPLCHRRRHLQEDQERRDSGQRFEALWIFILLPLSQSQMWCCCNQLKN